jgi:amidase
MAKLNVLTATAADLGKLLNEGTLTSEEAVSEYLKQIETYNGYLHAVISTPPMDTVLALARKLDQERLSGRVRGPLHGIPVLVKVRLAAVQLRVARSS